MTSSNSRNIAAVIFDLGSTLIYFDGEWPEILTQAQAGLFQELRQTGLILDETLFLNDFRQQLEAYYVEREAEFIEYTTLYTLRAVLAKWGYPDAPEPALRAALRQMYALTEIHWRTEADAHPMLQALQSAGYRLGLISNASDDENVQALVDNAGLRPYFDPLLTSAAQGIRKPNPRIFRTVLDYWGLPAARVAMVGDTLGADILGAQNAGLYSIWVTRRAGSPGNRAHLDTIRPDAVIATLSELPALLEKVALKDHRYV